jgi:hypothetical protein
MKPNAFQKILALIYLVVLAVCCIFYVPFRNTHGRYETEIVYDAILSDNSNIDLYRIGIYLLVLSVTFYFLYKYLNKMSDLEPSLYKRKAKNELIVFILFVLSIAVCLTYLISSNTINQIKKKSLTKDIQKAQNLVAEKSTKKVIRSRFWDESQRNFRYNVMVTKGGDTYRINSYDLRSFERDGYTHVRSLLDFDDFDNNIQTYWETLIKSKDNYDWLSSFYFYFSDNSLKQFNIKNTDDLKKFIEANDYNDEDVKKQEEVKVLTTDLNAYQAKKDALTFYQDKDIRRITLICLTILFGILYVARPLILFIRGIFVELK